MRPIIEPPWVALKFNDPDCVFTIAVEGAGVAVGGGVVLWAGGSVLTDGSGVGVGVGVGEGVGVGSKKVRYWVMT